MSEVMFPEIREALAKRQNMGKRVLPFFLRIGANAGSSFQNGKDTFSPLEIAAGQTLSITYASPSKGFVRLLRMTANVYKKEGIRFWSRENRNIQNPRKISKYLNLIGVSLKSGSSNRIQIGENVQPETRFTANDGNLADLCSNRVPGHSRFPLLVGPSDIVTVTFTNNYNETLYLSALVIGYRVNA